MIYIKYENKNVTFITNTKIKISFLEKKAHHMKAVQETYQSWKNDLACVQKFTVNRENYTCWIS